MPRNSPTGVKQRVQGHRDRMRARGMKLVQLWVPDTAALEAFEMPRANVNALAASVARAWVGVAHRQVFLKPGLMS